MNESEIYDRINQALDEIPDLLPTERSMIMDAMGWNGESGKQRVIKAIAGFKEHNLLKSALKKLIGGRTFEDVTVRLNDAGSVAQLASVLDPEQKDGFTVLGQAYRIFSGLIFKAPEQRLPKVIEVVDRLLRIRAGSL